MRAIPIDDPEYCRAQDSTQQGPVRPRYHLSDRAYCCELEDGAIILELETGRYFGIHEEYLPELRARVANWPITNSTSREFHSDASEKLIFELLGRGVLTESLVTKRSNMPLKTAPTASLLTADRSMRICISPVSVARMIYALLLVAIRCRRKGIEPMLGWLRREQGLLRSDDPIIAAGKAAELVATFCRLRIWFYTAHRRCLFDSLVLWVFLTQQGVPCVFVIGVSTKPFRAHAWVQIGQFVLNDTAEHVQTFAPILVVDECG